MTAMEATMKKATPSCCHFAVSTCFSTRTQIKTTRGGP
jgi:hypothetical protein